MAILNPRFDQPGAHPGEAEHWTLATAVARERIAGYGPEPFLGVDDFERWFELKKEFSDADLSLGFFDFHPEGFEDFEEGWSNDAYLYDLPTGHVVSCIFGSSEIETMDTGWLIEPYVRDWSSVSAVVAVFDGTPAEDFEQQWRENQDFARNWDEVTSQLMTFGTSLSPVETFETEWTAASTI